MQLIRSGILSILICLSLFSVEHGIADFRVAPADDLTNRPEIANPDSVADKKQRIALLIRDLEVVNAHPMCTPGYITFGNDPVVQALVAQGEDAVEPLLDALATDTRPTRTIDDGSRKVDPPRQRVVRVEEPILAALNGILRSRDQLPNLDEDYVNGQPSGPKLKPKELAKVIRAYWEKYRGKPLAERWYGLLADDTAGPAAWAEAASDLTLKESETVPVYGEFRFPPRSMPGTPDPMKGEVLRDKTKPTISELMVKRLRESCADLKDSTWPSTQPIETLAAALAKWDGENQLETLRWYSGELEKMVSKLEPNRGDPEELTELIRIYVTRKNCGDGQTTADYAKWMRSADAGVLSTVFTPSFFAPLWLYRKDPVITELTKWLFTNPASPWMSGAAGVDPVWISRAAITPLVAVPEFRTLLLGQLKNGPGADRIAGRLSEVRGVPAFSPDWPQDQRDKAVAAIADFVRQFGDRWAPKLRDPWEDPVSTGAVLHFPTLDHPATKEDVAEGRAIFSNEGASRRRTWSIPKGPYHQPPHTGGPTIGQWISLKDYPEDYHLSDGSQPLDQKVDIWQAEDSLVNGKWQRTLGVVAKHQIAAVPAEEIDFGVPESESHDGWQLSMDPNGSEAKAEYFMKVKPGGPMVLTVRAQNMRGVSLQFPKMNDGPVQAESLGLDIKAEYFPGPVNLLWTFTGSKWKPLPAREPLAIEAIPTPQTLAPLESAGFLKFDAAKMFDLSAPGFYRIELGFAKGHPFDSPRGARVEVEVTNKGALLYEW